MNTKEAPLRTSDTFRDLDRSRSTMNNLESLSDFIFEASKELLLYADTLKGHGNEGLMPQSIINNGESTRLQTVGEKRKGNGFCFFNRMTVSN